MLSFVTGSHAYGTPQVDSDIDLVVLVSKNDLQRMIEMTEAPEHERDYIFAGGIPLRFGRMNVIACIDRKLFDLWRKGTAYLKTKRPVSRDYACKYFQKLRERAGYSGTFHGTPPVIEDDIPF